MKSILLVVAILLGAVSISRPLTANDLRIMSFNIRYGTADDGENSWDHRKEFLIETIREFAPDLLGTQETLLFQRDYLASKLSDYEVIGVGRDDGQDQGEMTAIYYRRARFQKLSHGHFWLSLTPDVPGSRDWDAAITRMVTWVCLKDIGRTVPEEIVFANTHFDHRGDQARLESAKLIRKKLFELAQGRRIVLTGDFNAAEGSGPYRALFGETPDNDRLIDTFRSAHPTPSEIEGTFSQFSSARTSGNRIDWIAVSPTWQVGSAEIMRSAREGRTPSDHFPVTAVIR